MVDGIRDASAKGNIFQQIESAADSHAPQTYLDLLTHYGDLQIAEDPASNQFIPLTENRVSGRGREDGAVLFAVGVLPPAVLPRIRGLDRGASVLGLSDQVEVDLVTGTKPPGGAGGGQVPLSELKPTTPSQHGSHRKFRQLFTNAFTKVMGRAPSLGEIQYMQAVAALETSYGIWGPEDMRGSNNFGSNHCSKNQRTGGKTKCVEHLDHDESGRPYLERFVYYDSPEAGAEGLASSIFISTAASKGLSGPGASVMRASYIMRRQNYYSSFCKEATKKYGGHRVRQSFHDPDKDEATVACAKEATTAHAKRALGPMWDAALANGDDYSISLGSFEDAEAEFKESIPPPKLRATIAAALAKEKEIARKEYLAKGVRYYEFEKIWKELQRTIKAAKKETTKLQGTQLRGPTPPSPHNSDTHGAKLLAAQRRYALELLDAVERMKRTPPLKLLVNPKSFSVKGSKIVQDGNWSRNGPIVEHWGDGQDTISASGSVAGFFALDIKNAGGPGLTRYARNLSKAWQNFYSLYLLYKNNGAIYLHDEGAGSGPGAQNLTLVGSMYIYYDNVLYIGSFDNFNFSEDDTKPFTSDYGFEFTVRAAFVLDRTDDHFTYGAPGLQPPSIPIRSQDPTIPVEGSYRVQPQPTPDNDES